MFSLVVGNLRLVGCQAYNTLGETLNLLCSSLLVNYC